MNKLILAVTLILSLGLTACGKPEDKEKSPSEKNKYSLEAGSSFMDAPYNWIEFGAMKKNKTYPKQLSFKADRDGTLSLGLNTYGRGISCDNLEDAYKVDATFKIKRFSDKQVEVVERPNQLAPSFNLKEGDLLIVDFVVTSFTNCSGAQINIWATF